MGGIAATGIEGRSEPRDEILHRVRAMRADGATVSLVLVNLSPSGLMARSEVEFVVGETMRVILPVVGRVRATVRWALGGRIGCQLDATIPPAPYYEMLAAVRG